MPSSPPPREESRSEHPGDRPQGIDVHLDENGQPRIIERRFVVDENHDGKRLDQFLVAKIPRLSRTRIQEILRRSLSRDNGRPCRPNARVEKGETMTLHIEARPEPPCPRYFDVIYRDEHLMVINKPAGLPVHSTAKFYFNTLTRLLLERYGEPPPQICHRLDMETSGCMLIAFSKEMAAILKAAFAKKTTRKTYVALVHGSPTWSEGDAIDAPLGLIDDPAALIDIRMVVRDDGQPARTLVKVLSRPAPDYALVECKPITGRQHQIRAHLASVGFPIVGDKLYGHGDRAFQEFCEIGMTPELLQRFELPYHALHAAELCFPYPLSSGPASREGESSEGSFRMNDNGLFCARAALPERIEDFIARGCRVEEEYDLEL